MSMSRNNGILGKFLVGILVCFLVAGAGVLAFWLTHRINDEKNCTEMCKCAEYVCDAFENDAEGNITTPDFVYLGKFDVDYVKQYVFKNKDLGASGFSWGANNTIPAEGIITISVSEDGTLCYFAYSGYQWGYQTQVYQIDLNGKMTKITAKQMSLPEKTEEVVDD